jgi:hypothetical protein
VTEEGAVVLQAQRQENSLAELLETGQEMQIVRLQAKARIVKTSVVHGLRADRSSLEERPTSIDRGITGPLHESRYVQAAQGTKRLGVRFIVCKSVEDKRLGVHYSVTRRSGECSEKYFGTSAKSLPNYSLSMSNRHQHQRSSLGSSIPSQKSGVPLPSPPQHLRLYVGIMNTFSLCPFHAQ